MTLLALFAAVVALAALDAPTAGVLGCATIGSIAFHVGMDHRDAFGT